MAILTMKFGGASVGTTGALTQVLSIVLQEHERHDKLILVVSALDGVTDALIEAAELAQVGNRRGYRRITNTLRTRHLALIEHLPLGPTEQNVLYADIDRLLFDMLDICQALADQHLEADRPPQAIMDQIIGVGERIAARIVAALLRQNNLRGVAVDATDLIITDGVFGNARPDMALTRERIQQTLMPMLARDIMPVVTGFIGSTPTGNITTMGRGGSDYTASILAVCTNSDEVWMWTDVDGMMTANPREEEKARTIPHLSYDEVAELAYFGAHILHSRMIGPLRDYKIPLRIKNVFSPRKAGTTVRDIPASKNVGLKAVTSIHGLALTSIHSGPLTDISALIDDTMQSTIGNHTEVMITSQSSDRSFTCFVVPTNAGPDAVRAVHQALEGALEQSEVINNDWTIERVSIITVVGAGIEHQPQLVANIFQAMSNIPLLGLAQGPSGCSLSLVIHQNHLKQALQQIHHTIINSG